MSRDARWNALLELVGKNGRVDVEDAATALDVSAATIRRDLDQLAEQQLLTRTRGGAVAHGVSYELALRYKTGRHAPEKQAIGRAVSELVAVGEVVGLTGGTTLTEVARSLAVRSDVAVLGVNAIDTERGAYVHHEGEASINRLLAQQAQRVVVAADSSKIGKRAFARVCGLAQIDFLVTDKGITPEATARFTEAGVTVVAV
ncbi:DeoR/GlpR family DNA-binding transcription regulator [Streptomyces sp. NPDC089733]|uniref:DeoR/GlpR family DNA-binding transcription regulator n=1 Tax=Streptomyces sp. NPDC089733 TaxID=3365918 RepID=UPI0038174076